MTTNRFEIDDTYQPPRGRLTADEDDPEVSVATVAEHAFCARAGLLSQERTEEDWGEEELTFDPLLRYEIDAIRELLCQKFVYWAIYIFALIGTSVVAVRVIPDDGRWRHVGWSLVAMLFLVLAYRIVALTRDLLALLQQRHKALCGVEREFDFSDGSIQTFNWWDVYESGFASEKTRRLWDTECKLKGRPWRILVRGSDYVPVFRTHKTTERLKPQHIVRVMAYCHLVLANLGRASPFGVVLYGDTFVGVAVPNDPQYRSQFHAALVGTRETIRNWEMEGEFPPLPTPRSKCSKCRLAEPRRVEVQRVTRMGDHELDPFILWRSKQRFHCDCGDRFRWKPPHERIKQLLLRSDDEMDS
jgi:hypothetical protein